MLKWLLVWPLMPSLSVEHTLPSMDGWISSRRAMMDPVAEKFWLSVMSLSTNTLANPLP